MATEVGERVWPVVLAGGRSRRFGRDKLQQPMPGTPDRWLVDVAIGVLRSEFGRGVSLVGECDPRVAARADRVIPDRYPGVGPIGGLLSALEHTGEPVLILPGDLQRIDSIVIRNLRSGAEADASAEAVVLRTDRVQWCAGVFRPSVLGRLRASVASAAYSLRDAMMSARIGFVDADASSFLDADRPDDLRGN